MMNVESKNSLDLEEIISNDIDSKTINSNDSSNYETMPNQAQQVFADKIRNANKRVQSGDYNAALRLYNEALKLDHTNYVIYGNRSAIYCRLGKYDKALRDAIKARELNPTWSKAYYRQGIALQMLRRYADSLAAFASGLAQETKSIQLLSAFIETAMKSPLRATLEPIYRQLQVMNFDKSPFVITSVVGQELLGANHYAAAVVVLEAALRIGSCSLKLRGSVFSALSTAYWALNDLDQAISYMQQDLQVAKSLGDILGECRAHANLGSAFFAKCSYKEALASHRYQLVLAMKHKHTEQAALALTSLGHVYSAIGDLKNALSSHQQCLQIVRQSGDPLAEAREIGNVGAVHLASGEFDKAIECHLEHVKLAKLLGNKAEEARAYSNLGSAYHYRRQYEQAIQFHEQVLRISQEIGDRIIESKAYAGLGHAARCMKDFIQAKRWYERQLDAALNIKDKTAEAKACANLGIVYQLLGDSDGALKLHWSHLNICKHLNDHAGIGRAYGNIGSAYSSSKQFNEAIKYHKLELQIAKEVHDRTSEAASHGNLAIAYQSLSLYDEALTHLNLHLSLAKEINDINSEANALCNLGNFHSSRKNYEKAIYYYEHYLRLTRCLDDKESEAKASHYLGYAHYCLKRYDMALQYFNQDLTLSREIQDRDSIGRAYCHLGLVNNALGYLDQALECHKYYLCVAQDDFENKLKAMGYVADILTQQEKYSEAMKILEKKLTMAKSIGDIINEKNALQSLGACQKFAGNYEKAAFYYKQESQLANCVQDLIGEIRSLDNLGDCYFKSNNYPLALKCFTEQMEKCEQLNIQIESDQTAIDDYDSSGYYGRRKKLIDTFQEYLEARQMITKAYHNVANTRFRMGHFEEATNYYEKEMHLFHQAIERSEQLNRFSTSNPDSDCLSSDNNSQNNEQKLSGIIATILEDLMKKNIDCIRFIGDCHFAQRRYDEAVKYYLDFLSSSKSLVDQEQVYCLLSKCYQLMNNLTQALVSYEKRLVIAHEIGCEQTKAMAYGELGHLHQLLSNYEQAITCFKHQQELGKNHALKNKFTESSNTKTNDYKKSKINIGLLIEAEALHGLGCVAQEMHDYERALKYHSSALTIAQEIDSLELESRAYGAIGNAYNALGNYESAIRYQEKYLSVAQVIGDLNAQVGALSALGKINSTNGHYNQAVKYLQQALLIVENNNQNIGYRDEEEARICYELGMALWALNDLEIAETHLRRSVDLIENFHNLNSSITQLMMAPISSCNLVFNSNHYYSTSESSTGGSDASSTSSSHYGPLKWPNLMPFTSTAQPYHHYLHYQGASYEALIKILIALDRPTEALLIAERSRTRSFLKAKKGFRVFSITNIEQIVEMARNQNAAILYYSMTIDGSYNSWLITTNEVHFSSLLKSNREKILRLIKNVQNSLFQENTDMSKSFDLANDDQDDNQSYDRSMHHLKRNHFLNSSNYSLSSLFSLASSVTSTSTASSSHIRSRDRSSNHFNSKPFDSSSCISSFDQQSNNNDKNSPNNDNSNKMRRSVSYRYLNRNWQGFSSSTELYDILIGPYQEQLDKEVSIGQLLLVLDGDLFLVPWNMLKNKNEEFLSEKYSLLVIPSLHVLRGDQSTKTLRKDNSHSTLTSLVVANPTMPNKLAKTNPNQRQLYFENPASSKEAAFVSELLSTRPLIGTEANKEAVLAQLSTAQCIHFSSYIIDNTEGDPLKMATGLGIAISPSDVVIGDSAHQLHDHEYLLTPHDLISIGLESKLVVISCPAISFRSNSHAASLNASTAYSSSQVLKTITSALLQAGASCVLLTLWPVPISALQVLFRIFYCSLLQGTRVSTALKEAVSTIQNTSHFSHPRNWAGFILIGSDVRLSSQVALMSSSLATLLKTPEKSRDAMRVVLHLVEKSLQRIQRGQKNAMYTTVQSIDNKVGVNTQGWRDLLISVGFRFEPASTNGLPACVFFPQSDPNGRLIRCSTALQAILALLPESISAISKLLSNCESMSEIIKKLSNVIQHVHSDRIQMSSCLLSSYLEILNIKLWSTPGCHELYASLGFDLMEVGSDSVTLRAGKNANIRTIMFALQSLQALFDKENTNDNDSLENNRHSIGGHFEESQRLDSLQSSSKMTKVNENTLKKSIATKINNETIDNRDGRINYSKKLMDNKMRKKVNTNEISSLTKILSTHSISETPCSRGTIGRNPADAQLIELRLESMPPKLIDPMDNVDISVDLQSTSSQSSIATSSTVLNRQLPFLA